MPATRYVVPFFSSQLINDLFLFYFYLFSRPGGQTLTPFLTLSISASALGKFSRIQLQMPTWGGASRCFGRRQVDCIVYSFGNLFFFKKTSYFNFRIVTDLTDPPEAAAQASAYARAEPEPALSGLLAQVQVQREPGLHITKISVAHQGNSRTSTAGKDTGLVPLLCTIKNFFSVIGLPLPHWKFDPKFLFQSVAYYKTGRAV